MVGLSPCGCTAGPQVPPSCRVQGTRPGIPEREGGWPGRGGSPVSGNPRWETVLLETTGRSAGRSWRAQSGNPAEGDHSLIISGFVAAAVSSRFSPSTPPHRLKLLRSDNVAPSPSWCSPHLRRFFRSGGPTFTPWGTFPLVVRVAGFGDRCPKRHLNGAGDFPSRGRPASPESSNGGRSGLRCPACRGIPAGQRLAPGSPPRGAPGGHRRRVRAPLRRRACPLEG